MRLNIKSKLIPILALMSAPMGAPAQEIPEPGSPLETSFLVTVPASGEYSLAAWGCPSLKKGIGYTRFEVLVNQSSVGWISPTRGGFQQLSLDSDSPVALNAGENTIAFSAEGPDYPCVETVKIGETAAQASFDQTAYDSYLSHALAGDVCQAMAEEESHQDISETEALSGLILFPGLSQVPLKYSVYRIFRWTRGDSVMIRTSSPVDHVVDVFYHSTGYNHGLTPLSGNLSENSDAETMSIGNGTSDLVPIELKLGYAMSPTQMQGINYRGNSEVSLTDPNAYEANVRIWSVPLTGNYMVACRSAQDGVLSTVDIDINGETQLDSMPIYCAQRQIEQRAGADIGTMTKCTDSDADPILFIEGADASRVVGFNDDAPTDKVTQYGLSSKDSYVSKTYFVKTTGVHVSNYSSLNPESTCDIWARVLDSSDLPVLSNTQSPVAVGLAAIETTSASPCASMSVVNGHLVIKTDQSVNLLRAYDMMGNMCGSLDLMASEGRIGLWELGISHSGVYVISLDNGKGRTTKKIVAR
ncbi:MAG: T9SS type A sorting domain-containing protein [Bacteroidales bacterium]|nr:T9SS type A sorting domain-containing protein [Bacteroidales bacterium]